jgi:virulence factor Mce-like protein
VTSGPSYSLTAVFANALNLPNKAKVKLGGADIGEVDAIRVHNFNAYVTMHIESEVPIYAGSIAELRSATPLGDIFVAIKPVADQRVDAPRLRDGDTIPLDSTRGAATVEELLSSASLLVNGGTIRQLVTVLNGAGDAAGGNGAKIATLLQQSNQLLSRLDARSQQLQESLRATTRLSQTLKSNQDTLNAVLAAAAPATDVLAENTDQLAQTTDTVAAITQQLSRFPSLQGTDTRSVFKDLNALSNAFNEIALDPNLSLYQLNRLTGITMKTMNSAALHANANIMRIALGNHPDKNYPGDPATHGPDGTDFHQMVGSLRYEWNLMLDRIYGSDR